MLGTIRRRFCPHSPHSFAVNVGIEQAAHLPNVVVNKKSGTRRLPNCFVTFVPFDATSAQDPVSTPVVYASDNPKWNFVTATNLPAELLDPREKKLFILKVSGHEIGLVEVPR